MSFITKNIAKISFVTIGLLVIFFVGYLNRNSSLIANDSSNASLASEILKVQLVSGMKFGDWTTVCKSIESQEICYLEQKILKSGVIFGGDISASSEDSLIAQYKIFFHKESNKIEMTQILPFGVHLQKGTVMLLDNNKIAVYGVFTMCDPNLGCIAIADITQDLGAITSSSKSIVNVVTVNGEKLQILFSNNGLNEGVDALKHQ